MHVEFLAIFIVLYLLDQQPVVVFVDVLHIVPFLTHIHLPAQQVALIVIYVAGDVHLLVAAERVVLLLQLLVLVVFADSFLQKNVVHIKDNLDILDFTLTDDEMAAISRLNKGKRYYIRTDEALAGFAGWQPTY